MAKWIKNEQSIVDVKNSSLVCLLPSWQDEMRDKMIELAPEMFDALFSFVKGIEDNTFKAKSTYNDLKYLFSRIPEHLIEEYEINQV